MSAVTKLESSQTNRGPMVASARLEPVVYETMLRVAELNGYETVSSFCKDAILDKIKSTARAMAAIVEEQRDQVFSLGD